MKTLKIIGIVISYLGVFALGNYFHAEMLDKPETVNHNSSSTEIRKLTNKGKNNVQDNDLMSESNQTKKEKKKK